MIDYELMRTLHDQGLTAGQIAAEMGCCTRTVTRWRRDTGRKQDTPANACLPLTPERREAARRLLDDGASLKEVRRTLGTTFRTLHRHFPEHAGWTSQQGGQLGAWVHHNLKALESNRKAAA